MLYEDDGESFGYIDGEYSFTDIRTEADESSITVTVLPRRGHYNGASQKRIFALVRGKKRVEFEVDAQKIFVKKFDI